MPSESCIYFSRHVGTQSHSSHGRDAATQTEPTLLPREGSLPLVILPVDLYEKMARVYYSQPPGPSAIPDYTEITDQSK